MIYKQSNDIVKGEAIENIAKGKAVYSTVRTIEYTAGEFIKAGAVVYLNAKDGKVYNVPNVKHSKLRIFFNRLFPIKKYKVLGVAANMSHNHMVVRVIINGFVTF